MAGQQATLEVDNAGASAKVAFRIGLQGPGSQPCLPGGLACGGLASPTVLAVVNADAAGNASLTHRERAWQRGRPDRGLPGGLVRRRDPDGGFSPVVSRIVQP